MRRSFKYRLFVNANQERELGITLESHRRLYNACLEQRKTAYETNKISIKYADQSTWFKGARAVNPYFARLNFSSAQATMRRLDKAYAEFFRRVREGSGKPGYPKFKKCNQFNSIEFPAYRDGISLTDNKLYVQYVGTIRVRLHRPVEGKIKTVTLKKEADKWFVIFSCELPDVPLIQSDKPAIGIDVGLAHFLTTSDGTKEPNPRFLKNALPGLRVANRAVSRKMKGGNNRRKAARRLQKIHNRIKNLRKENHYRIACHLVLAHRMIAAESLNILEMMKNRRFSGAIIDAGWASFLSVLRHKAEKAGVQFVEVEPSGTSQRCSQCGLEVHKNLSVRWHDCPNCGLSLDRDHNAALNILARGLARTAPARVNVDH